MALHYFEHEKIDIAEFQKNIPQAIDKLARRECEKLAVLKGSKVLFYVINYEHLKGVLNNLLKPKNEEKQTNESQKIEVPTVVDEKGNELKNLSQAQEMLLKVRQKFDFFKNLSDLDVLKVTQDVSFLRLKRGEIVFEQASEGKEVYFIISGGIEISVSGEKGGGAVQKYADRITLVILKPEQIFGEMAAVTKEPRSARATATQDGTTLLCFKINEEIDDTNIKAYNILLQNFVRILSDKLRQTNQMLYEKRKNN